MIGVLAAGVIAASALVAVRTSTPAVARPAAIALAPRPPVEAIAALPLLAAELDSRSRFMGAILVARGDQILFRQAYGMADADQRRPSQLNTRFRLASVSKQFTAAAILMLVEEGKLKLDEPIKRWFPDITAADKITVRQILPTRPAMRISGRRTMS